MTEQAPEVTSADPAALVAPAAPAEPASEPAQSAAPETPAAPEAAPAAPETAADPAPEADLRTPLEREADEQADLARAQIEFNAFGAAPVDAGTPVALRPAPAGPAPHPRTVDLETDHA